MPIWTPGPAGHRPGVGEPAGEAAAALGHDVEARRQPRPGLAVEGQHPPAGADAATDSRVSASAASASAAASTGVHGGHNRVFTRPGTGDLAITNTCITDDSLGPFCGSDGRLTRGIRRRAGFEMREIRPHLAAHLHSSVRRGLGRYKAANRWGIIDRTCAVRILVTGGAGFIGSHVVDRLVAGGATVSVVDSLAPAVHHDHPRLP